MVVKWSIICIIEQLTPNFLWESERIWNVRGSEGERAEKKENIGVRKKHSEQAMAKKERKKQSGPKFWLMRVRQIEILHILVPNLGEIYLFGKK